MSNCPACDREQPDGLLCHYCCEVLERELGDVPAIVAELDITLSKQARIGIQGAPGLARERTPINVGAIDPRWVLDNVLTTWVRDVHGDRWVPPIEVVVYRDPYSLRVGPFCWSCSHPSCKAMRLKTKRVVPISAQCAAALLSAIPSIRRHPAVVELVDQVCDAIHQARRAVDRPADQIYLGQCWMENPDEDGRQVTCLAELYARPQAHEVSCRTCGTEHPVAERRAWLLSRAADMIVTVKEASSYLGEVGGITVSQASIRGYLHRGKLAYRPGVTNGIRLGDLLDVLLDESERKTA